MMCSTILLCFLTSKYDINGSRLNYITVSGNKFKYINMKIIYKGMCSSDSFALKKPLEVRLGICIYKTLLLHRPDDYVGFTPSCPPHILQQNCAHDLVHLNLENLIVFEWVLCDWILSEIFCGIVTYTTYQMLV